MVLNRYLFVFISLLFAPICFGQLYTFRNYSHKEGLALSSVSSLAEDKEGYIWLGTEGAGLIRFDGTNFEEYKHEGFDNKRFVQHILVDENSKLHITSTYLGYAEIEYGKKPKITVQNKNIHKKWPLATVKFGDELRYVLANGVFTQEQLIKKAAPEFSFPKNDTRILQSIVLSRGTILFTNNGNFIVTKKGTTPLGEFLGLSKSEGNSFKCGRFKDGWLQLFNGNMSKSSFFRVNEQLKVTKEKKETYNFNLGDGDSLKLATFSIHSNIMFAVSAKGRLIKVGQNPAFLANNYNRNINTITTLLIDKNDIIWIGTRTNGIYKLSVEPFTQILLHPVYEQEDIFTIYAKSNDIIISDKNKTYTAKLFKDQDFKEFDFFTASIVTHKDVCYLGTSEGLKIFRNSAFEDVRIPKLENEPITLVFSDGQYLWVSYTNKGLHKIKIEDKAISEIKQVKSAAQYFYCAAKPWDESGVYFGSNDGIYFYSNTDKTFKIVDQPRTLGAYFGNVTTDSYQTIWFTGNDGLFGVDRYGNKIVLDDPELFNSTLFYTLSSDNSGNLIIGTNKGLTLLNVDERGFVKHKQYFTGANGFSGYETNMRASFKNEHGIFLGTVEGLYLISTPILKNHDAPDKPYIHQMFSTTKGRVARRNEYTFSFQVINPRYQSLQYSYRIKEKSDSWSDLTEATEATFSSLNEGIYTFQVKATYDGLKYSEISESKIEIAIPFYQTNLFIVLLIVVLGLINIVILTKFKSFDQENLFETKDFGLSARSIPYVILIGSTVINGLHYFITKFDANIIVNYTSIQISFGAFVLIFGLSLLAYQRNEERTLKRLLILSFTILSIQQLYYIYESNLNPYFIIHSLLLFTLSSIILPKLKHTLYFAGSYLLVTGLIIYLSDDSIINEFSYISICGTAIFYVVFATFLRFNSLEKLVFISGVINKGNVPVIAFNNKGIITYASENIDLFFELKSEQLVGEKIAMLNDFVPQNSPERDVNLSEQFIDGTKYIVPMVYQNKTVWVEWLCKTFSNRIKVILGIDITERIEIESNYELLVQNANDLIYQTDVSGRFVFANQKSIATLGYNFDEVEGASLLEFVPQEFHFKIKRFYKNQFVKKLESTYFEFPVIRKTGEIFWIGQNVTTLFDVNDMNKVKGYLSVARDITEKRNQDQIIRQQSDDITASINYARRIQFNLLPNQENFDRSFDESFVMYRPKDIVSGDFYYLEDVDHYSILVAADCTGHGVPGSFMTLLGINLLNSIIQENKVTDPAEILNQLNARLLYVLPRGMGDDKITDGMEVTVCIFDHNTGNMKYACAGSKFLVHHKDKLELYKGDIYHIGDTLNFGTDKFTSHEVTLGPNDTVYLFSDGFQDQFGGRKDKKFSFRRLYNVLSSNIRLSLFHQYGMIEEEFSEWKGETDQTDDVMIIGIRGIKKSKSDEVA